MATHLYTSNQTSRDVWVGLVDEDGVYNNAGHLSLVNIGASYEAPLSVPRIFTTTVTPQAELDAGNVSDGLRQAFADVGVELETAVAVTIINAGKQWQVNNDGQTYTIFKLGDVLGIYRDPTYRLYWGDGTVDLITSTNYQLISDTVRLQGTHNFDQIGAYALQIYMVPTNATTVASLPISLQDDLTTGIGAYNLNLHQLSAARTASPALIQAFSAAGITLTLPVTVTTQVEGIQWQLQDANETYLIFNAGDSLAVYENGHPVPFELSSRELVVISNNDLRVETAVSSNPATSGDTLQYTMSVINDSPYEVTGVQLTTTIPVSTTYVSVIPEQGSCNQAGNDVLCALQTIPGNNAIAVTLTVLVDPQASGMLENSSVVHANQGDPVPGNNSITTLTPVTHTSDVSVSLSTSAIGVRPGEVVTYTLVVQNDGPSAVAGLVVSNTLPAEVGNGTWICTSSTGAVCASSGSGDIYETVDILPESMISYTVTALWEADQSGTNHAALILPATVHDPDLTNNQASITNNEYNLFLPVVMNNVVNAPDLVVTDIVVDNDWVEVTIANIGNAAVTEDFWVDLYVDPHPVPTSVNQIWQEYNEQGVAWGVKEGIAPGGTLTLTLSSEYTHEGISNFTGVPAGTPIYVQVDSADLNTAYGAVYEVHEIRGEAYNNISNIIAGSDH